MSAKHFSSHMKIYVWPKIVGQSLKIIFLWISSRTDDSLWPLKWTFLERNKLFQLEQAIVITVLMESALITRAAGVVYLWVWFTEKGVWNNYMTVVRWTFLISVMGRIKDYFHVVFWIESAPNFTWLSPLKNAGGSAPDTILLVMQWFQCYTGYSFLPTE